MHYLYLTLFYPSFSNMFIILVLWEWYVLLPPILESSDPIHILLNIITILLWISYFQHMLDIMSEWRISPISSNVTLRVFFICWILWKYCWVRSLCPETIFGTNENYQMLTLKLKRKQIPTYALFIKIHIIHLIFQ